eukprot:403332443
MEHPSKSEGTSDKFFRYVNEMDFEGQKLAENIIKYSMILSAVGGFAFGYVTEKFSNTVYVMLACMIFLFLVTGPSFGIYKKHELQWRAPVVPEDIRKQAQEKKKQ